MRRLIAIVGVRKTGAFFESSDFHLAHFVEQNSGTALRHCRAQRADRIRCSFVLLKRCCELHRLALLAPADGSPTAAAPASRSRRTARRRVRNSKTRDVAPKKHCCEERDEDKCPQLHSCVSYEHCMCCDRTGQANPSAQNSRPRPVLSVVALSCGLSRLSKAGETNCRGCICLTARARVPVLTSPAHHR